MLACKLKTKLIYPTKTPIQSAIKIRIQIWLRIFDAVRLSFAKLNSQECLGQHENISIIAIVLESSYYAC